MNIIKQYKYLSKPLLLALAIYFRSSSLIKYAGYLFIILHLSSESYNAYQYRGQADNLKYLTKFWTLFGILLGSDFISTLCFGDMWFPTITNIIRITYLLWLIRQPQNVITTFEYVEPYLKIVSDSYNTFLLYGFALLS